MGLLSTIWRFISGPENVDVYAIIKASPATLDKSGLEVSEALRGPEVPNLGEKHEALLKRAMAAYPSDVLRIKWLQSIKKLREGKTQWILEGGKAVWGSSVNTR